MSERSCGRGRCSPAGSTRALALGMAMMAAACGGDAESSSGARPPAEAPVGLAPAGAQDFGLFRSILEAGQLPAPDTLDDIGFFAEHKLVFPDPECGAEVCLHGLLGVMGNLIDGLNCTLVVMGLNTPLDPSTLERPPLHLVVAVDTSAEMGGDPLSFAKLGIVQMLSGLEAHDEVSLVRFSEAAEVLVERRSPAHDRAELEAAIGSLQASGQSDLFDGLFTALSLADAHFDPAKQNRVMFVSDGVSSAGIPSAAKAIDLAAAYARRGIGLTTIGVGDRFDAPLMRGLGELGAGNFYFLEDASAVVEVFGEEVAVFTVPVALDVRITVRIDEGYVLREGFGASSWSRRGDTGEIRIPALFLAGRTDTGTAPEGSRRGGGGAMLVEVMPDPKAPAPSPDLPASYRVGTLELEYTDPATGALHTQTVTVLNTALPGEWPSSGLFQHAVAEKAFVMLNLFVGFRMASERAAAGDLPGALGVLQALRGNVSAWIEERPDGDIEDDLRYVDLFIDVVRALRPEVQAVAPATPWPFD